VAWWGDIDAMGRLTSSDGRNVIKKWILTDLVELSKVNQVGGGGGGDGTTTTVTLTTTTTTTTTTTITITTTNIR